MAVGVDTHIVMVPNPSGQVPTPLPHPFIGKLNDKLSDDVEIGGKKAAVKGSKAKFDQPGHIAMPPGTSFQNSPKNEAEVSGGCCDKVKINGKDACTLGSQATSCDDVGMQNQSTIVAMGAAVPLPIMVPNADPLSFKIDGGFVVNTRDPVSSSPGRGNDKKPKLSSPQWGSSSAKVGEEVTLSVSCSDLYEGATVYFTIWEEGFDPAVDVPVAKVKGRCDGSKAEGKWACQPYAFPEIECDRQLMEYYQEQGLDCPREFLINRIRDYTAPFDNVFTDKAKLVFTAEAFKCEKVESSSIEIGAHVTINIVSFSNRNIKNLQYEIIEADGNTLNGSLSKGSESEHQNMIPGHFQIRIKGQ